MPKTKQEKFEDIKATLAEWCEKYPQTFTMGKDVHPLAIGIHKELQAEGYSRTTIRKALHYYTAMTLYLHGMHVGKPRKNLKGENVETPKPEDKEYAGERLRTRKAAKLKRKAKTSNKAPGQPVPVPALEAMTTPAPEAEPGPAPAKDAETSKEPAPTKIARPLLSLKSKAGKPRGTA